MLIKSLICFLLVVLAVDAASITKREKTARLMPTNRQLDMPLDVQQKKGGIQHVRTQHVKGVGDVETIAIVHSIGDSHGMLNTESVNLLSTPCCNFISHGSLWKKPITVLVDTMNGDGMTDAFVFDVIQLATRTWDRAVSQPLFADVQRVTFESLPDPTAVDGDNTVFFGVMNKNNVIGAVYIHGIFDGPSEKREIMEFDIVFNEHLTWGDVTVNSKVADLMNSAMEFVGHALGIVHPPDVCTESTMYSITKIGERKKRTLTLDDEICLCTLYNDMMCADASYGLPRMTNGCAEISFGLIFSACVAFFL